MEITQLYNMDGEDKPAKDSPVLWAAMQDCLQQQVKQFQQMNVKQAREVIVSELNYQERSQLKSCRLYELTIAVGDVCYIDYGKAYQLETGFQHFGLVMSIFNAKAFVVPMTSNFNTYLEAYDEKSNPKGMKHLMRVGKLEGLYKYSVLYLNDGKFINMARIIDIKGHVDKDSPLFKEVQARLRQILNLK